MRLAFVCELGVGGGLFMWGLPLKKKVIVYQILSQKVKYIGFHLYGCLDYYWYKAYKKVLILFY